MNRFRSGTTISPINQIEAYWTALRDDSDDGLVPSRAQVDPRGLENVLANAFILERVAPGVASFRLAGQAMARTVGTDVRGMPLSAVFTAEARSTIAAVLEKLFDEPCIVELTLRTEGSGLRAGTEARMILLPLRSEMGDVSRALGAFVADETPSKQPCRLEVAGTAFRPIGTELFDAPSPELQHPLTTSTTKTGQSAGFAEAAPAPLAGAPHLRIVK